MTQIHTLLWLGAGHGQISSKLLENAERVVMIEARADAISALEARYPEQSAYQIIHAVVAPRNEDTTFYVTNLADYSASTRPTGIKDVYPSLKVAETLNVKTRAIDEIVAELHLDGAGINHLFIDIPDQAQSLIEALHNHQLLSLFSTLEIQLSDNHYEGSGSLSQLDKNLVDKGFEQVGNDTADPDFPIWLFKKNPLWAVLKEAEAQLAAKDQELATIQQQLAAETSEKLKQAETFGKELAEASEQLARLRAAKDEELATIQLQLTAEASERAKLSDQCLMLNKKIADVSSLATKRLEKVTHLESINRRMEEKNVKLNERQEVLDQEMVKAHAQINLIKDLFLNS